MTELEKLQRGMPKALKAEHDAMPRSAALKVAADLRAHVLKIQGLGIDTADNERLRLRYFELLADSKKDGQQTPHPA